MPFKEKRKNTTVGKRQQTTVAANSSINKAKSALVHTRSYTKLSFKSTRAILIQMRNA